MAKLTKAKLEQVLRERLGLGRDAHFDLHAWAGRFSGAMVSTAFRGKRDHERQKMIWDALDAEFGAESVQKAGMLLAYTPEEWSAGEHAVKAIKAAKAG